MVSVWLTPELADEIMRSDDIFEQTQNLITDIISDKITITHLVENMGGVLTNKEATNREKGMRFFTKLLKELPKNYLNENQVKFISKFYIDRLKDHHRVIPDVLDGYLAIIDMDNYNMSNSGEFLTVLFREVACQSQVRQDRYNVYLIVKKLLDKDLEYMKTLGPDFVYGIISAMDGERDPRNLIFLFSFLPYFCKNIPLGHLKDEMFEVISCYYPIDFHPAPDDPAAVSRQDLADALKPCLCANPEFGESCLVLLIEKLDSSLRLAKIDSLKLLTESCKTFDVESYKPFLKALWSSIHREILHKTDEELRMASHEALSGLVNRLATSANTDKAFENFVQGILIAMSTTIAESTTVVQFVQSTRVLLTTANASKESCVIVTNYMIPASISYYEFKTSPKLQIACLDFVGDLYDIAKYWGVVEEIKDRAKELPQLCLTAISVPVKEFQIAGFKALIRVIEVLETDLVVPFVEVLVHNVQHCLDADLLKVSVETVNAIARKYPELIMDLVVKGKCDLENLVQDEEGDSLRKRLNLLSNLASIDEFTRIILEEMLKVIRDNKSDAPKVVEALSESMSDSSLYSDKKLTEIESDHGLIDSVLNWLLKEIEENKDHQNLNSSYLLISNTMSSLPIEKQEKLLERHSAKILDLCAKSEIYFMVLESLYNSLQRDVYNSTFGKILTLALRFSLSVDNEEIRTKGCALVAHFLNKAEYGQKFELLYELLKKSLEEYKKDDEGICPKLILLYGWITKALIIRGSDLFQFWLQKIINTLSHDQYSIPAAESIRLIMNDQSHHLTPKQHCRVSLLYKQRMFVTFAKLTEKLPEVGNKEAYLLSWAFVAGKAPKGVLISEVQKITPILTESLQFDNTELVLIMLEVLDHFIQTKQTTVGDSLQTILPRLVSLTRYAKSMDVRIKSLECLYDIANSYRTSLLLPFKQDLLFDLAPSLDDKKRLVRNMAVKARTRWFLIGAPGEAKDN